jgi:hypothetical protein
MTLRRAATTGLYALVVIAILVLFGRVTNPAGTGFILREVLNFTHVPVFGALAVMLLGLCQVFFGERLTRARQYLVAFSWAVASSGISEVVQVYGTRTSSALDFARNVSGAAVSLLLLACVDPALRSAEPWRRSGMRRFAAAAAMVLLLATFSPVLYMVEACRRQEARFPVLFSFDAATELTFGRCRNSTLQLVRPPAGWDPGGQRRVGRLTFQPAAYPSLMIRKPVGNWEGYGYLELDLFSAATDGEFIVLRVEDEWDRGVRRDRFSRKINLEPGPMHLRVPLSEVRAAPLTRDLDLKAIRSVTLYSARVKKPFTIYLANLRLTPP